MDSKNYYEILNIGPESDLNAVKKAFRKEISIYHPDVNSSAEAVERFDLVVEAFDVLGNEDRRKIYDLQWSEDTQQEFQSEFNNHPNLESWEDESRKRSQKYRSIGLEELLLLELTAETGIVDGLLTGSGDIIDSISDALDGLSDLF